ncbi:MAG TPA: glycosyltransferase N-terminal domain-containing protein [Pirellulales bacterium]|nr:glycosyltransferase N-terminal domain-containing protein [Pirellulales bacterium]
MAYLFNLLYAVLLVLYSPVALFAAWRKGKYRAGLGQRVLGLVPMRPSPAPLVWLHAVSLGEVSLIASLVEEVRRRHPAAQIAISSTTVTGYVLAKTRYPDHTVFYCPLDFTWAVRRALRRLRPDLLVLVELELWPNLIAAAKAQGVKLAIVNGRMSDRSFAGYSRLRLLVRRSLAALDLVAVQSPRDADRFLALGARPSTVQAVGSLKFDGAATDRENPVTARLRQLAGFRPGDTVFLAGSTQHPEEQMALDAYRELSAAHPELRLVLVPRHPDRFDEVARLLADSGLSWQRRSHLDSGHRDAAARVLLVDKVGELAAWWGTAGIAFVGGSMGPRNGQNMIEPAAYGVAVSFGPHTRNFRDVVAALLAGEGAIVVRDGGELARFVRCCLENPAEAQQLGARAARVVASQLGATQRTAELLDALLPQDRPVAQARRQAA